jgi:PAS domain S-box-containing protein
MSPLFKTGGLPANRESYQGLFQDLQDMVLLTSPSGDLIDINQAGVETLNYSSKTEILRFPVTRHYADPGDRRRLLSILEDRGSVRDFETRLVKRDGKEIDVWITGHTRKDDQGRIICYEKMIKDVTDRKLVEDELRKKNRLLEKHYLDLRKEKDRIEAQAGMLAKAVHEAEESRRIVEEQNRRLSVELDMAAKLQRSILPRRYPRRKGVYFASKYVPSNRIGGDFFDIIELGNGDVGVVIADVSGHGPAAALLTTMFKMSFQMYAQETFSPSSVLAKLNTEFCRLITTGEYITAFYFILNTKKRGVIYSKAGHPYPILYRRKTKSHELLNADGFFIGMFDEAVFEDRETSLDPGDRLLLYTDGAIEARNPDGHSFELRHLKNILAEYEDLSCNAMIEEIYRQLSQFTQRDHFEDDLCLVLVSVGG